MNEFSFKQTMKEIVWLYNFFLVLFTGRQIIMEMFFSLFFVLYVGLRVKFYKFLYATAAAVWVVFCCILFVQCRCECVLVWFGWKQCAHTITLPVLFYHLHCLFLLSLKVQRLKIAILVNVFWKMFCYYSFIFMYFFLLEITSFSFF